MLLKLNSATKLGFPSFFFFKCTKVFDFQRYVSFQWGGNSMHSTHKLLIKICNLFSEKSYIRIFCSDLAKCLQMHPCMFARSNIKYYLCPVNLCNLLSQFLILTIFIILFNSWTLSVSEVPLLFSHFMFSTMKGLTSKLTKPKPNILLLNIFFFKITQDWPIPFWNFYKRKEAESSSISVRGTTLHVHHVSLWRI